MTLYCGKCGEECCIETYDDSFDHEFGIEEVHHYGSSCCGASVYREVCPDCEGTGEVLRKDAMYSPSGRELFVFKKYTDCCDNCDGTGLIYEVDLSEELED